MRNIKREATVTGRAGCEHVEAGCDHFRPDAVAADRRDLVGTHEFPFVSVQFSSGDRTMRGASVLAPRACQEHRLLLRAVGQQLAPEGSFRLEALIERSGRGHLGSYRDRAKRGEALDDFWIGQRLLKRG